MPLPLQNVHLMAFVPGSQRLPLHLGQVSTMLTLMSLFTPRAASVKRRFTNTLEIKYLFCNYYEFLHFID